MHLCEQCVSFSHYKGNDVRGECLVDRKGQEKSHACLPRYQVSLNEGFEVSLIISSHLSRCLQHVFSWRHKPSFMWCKNDRLMNCSLGFVNFTLLMFSPAVYISFQIAMLWHLSKGICTLQCSPLAIRDENISLAEWRRCIFQYHGNVILIRE